MSNRGVSENRVEIVLNFNYKKVYANNSFALELKNEICKNDWTESTGGIKLTLIDEAGHRSVS